MQIPVFEIKDSYIVKHKLEYNTSYDFGSYTDNGFTSYKQRMIFVDNDIARKSQSLNAENFESITINNNLSNIEKIEISYFDDIHTIYFDGVLEYENQWIKDTNVYNYTRPIQSQEFKTVVVNNISTGDTVSVEIYKKTTETGSVDWEYTSTTPNEKWSISGLTSTGNQWVVNGNNTVIGYETGSTTWSYDKITPYLKYESNVLSVTNYTVTLEKKIDDYIFNNFSSDSDIYYKIITNNHCTPNYSYLYDKLKYYKYFDYFIYDVKLNSITITPVKSSKNIYFNYDKILFKLTESGFGYSEYDSSGHTYSEGYGVDIQEFNYIFNTNNIYNKYTLGYLLNQFDFNTDIIYKGKTTVVNYTETGNTTLVLSVDNSSYFQIGNDIIIETVTGNTYNTYTSSIISKSDVVINDKLTHLVTINRPLDFTNTEYILSCYIKDEDVVVTQNSYTIDYITFNVDTIFNFREYTYIKIKTNMNSIHNAIINNISGNTITILTPNNYQSGETITNISNLKTINDISFVLDKTYENYNQDEYKKLTIKQQRKIYNTYADIINKELYNQTLRLNTTGLIFENEKNIMTLKIFDPSDYKDNRLLYEPTEIVKIGKDKKTSIPIIIKDFKIGLSADTLDENIYSIYVFDPNIEDIVLVIDANFS